MATRHIFGSNPEIKISQKPKKTTQRNYKTDDKMDKSYHFLARTPLSFPSFNILKSLTILVEHF